MRDDGQRLIGQSEVIRRLQAEVDRAATSDAKVLITGESGVGKEVVARLVHEGGHRSARPLLTMNCSGVPDSLLESELFGHVRGSFTGAYRDKPGLLQLADRGTIFMDEVGEMSLRMQASLLRFLEGGEIQRVGATHAEARVDVRVIAATNRNLAHLIASGAFREDLYYRLNVVHFTVVPLRERAEDIPLLVDYFMRVYAERHRRELPRLSPDALSRLAAYRWPGNIRQLKNVIERLIILTQDAVITPAHLPVEIGTAMASSVVIGPSGAVSPPAAVSRVDGLMDQMVNKGQSFWNVVYPPFISRDLTREDLRLIIADGLERTHGNYKPLLGVFNMEPRDYKRFMNFLHKFQCHLPFQRFRASASSIRSVTAPPTRVSAADAP